MVLNKDIATKTAESLLQIKAVKLNKNNPFTWASGWKSPIYCDNRKTLSYPPIRTFLRQEFSKIIKEEFGDIDVIAGVATGAIALGVLVAQELGKPFVYVRSGSKDHGLKNQIEGIISEGQTVVVVEDLISTGGSSLAAVDALREVGAIVKGMVAIFTYGFKVSEDKFKEADVRLFTLSDYETLIKQAVDSGFVKEEDLKSLMVWRKSPDTWAQ
ncbi:MAG: orotate phosphoribosyltransferase [Bacteroidetes bacterium CG2_30_33_31]|nr:MAG: orotate phosphoribosyltransferase [Bacteroidetes bacterium CG2_30_33_31]